MSDEPKTMITPREYRARAFSQPSEFDDLNAARFSEVAPLRRKLIRYTVTVNVTVPAMPRRELVEAVIERLADLNPTKLDLL